MTHKHKELTHFTHKEKQQQPARNGWRYSLTDITERRITNVDTRNHVETVEINTDTKELNDIIRLLSPTLEHETSDGYLGVLALDISSVNCEVAGYRSSSYTATATREYPHLSSADISLIPDCHRLRCRDHPSNLLKERTGFNMKKTTTTIISIILCMAMIAPRLRTTMTLRAAGTRYRDSAGRPATMTPCRPTLCTRTI